MNPIKPSLFFISFLTAFFAQANVNDHFTQIKTDPKALYQFFKNMPKGGELHYHLAGGSSPETMLQLASQGNYCLNKSTYAVSKAPGHCDGVAIKDILNYPELYTQTIKDWSMEGFIPGKESGHDHFFKGFNKYMPIVVDYRPQLIADIIQRAAQQEEQYLELMDIADNANSLSFAELLRDAKSYDQKKEILLANTAFQNNIAYTVSHTDDMLKQARQQLGCDSKPDSKPCQVTVKFIYYTLREQPLNQVFSQTLNAFEAVSRSQGNLIGVNLVQPEDGMISLRDFQEQMLIFNYLHQHYPQVHIALHAGELTPELVDKHYLGKHIYEALVTGKAERIGHGVDVKTIDQGKKTLDYMAQNNIPVEINLISNKKILNVFGAKHPLNTYLEHQVPVVFSTDDEGVLRTDLTQQYVEAVMEHGLDYHQLKTINRNTLTYAFVPGKSIWANPAEGILVTQCQDLNSLSCKEFVNQSEKAALQWKLEQKLADFEKSY